MAKFTKEIDGKTVEFELENKELLEALGSDGIIDGIDTKDKTFMDMVIEKLGFKRVEKKETKKKDDENDDEGDELNLPAGVKKILEANQKKIESLESQVTELKTQNENNAKSQTSKAAAEILADAVKKGRIAQGEVDAWNKKFENVYKGDVDILKDVIESRPVDPNIRVANANNNGKPPTLGTDGKPVEGVRTFTRAEIADKDFYKANRDEIIKAQAAGTII